MIVTAIDGFRELSRKLMEIVENSSVKMTPSSLEKMLWRERVVNRRELRTALRMLVESGELTYSNVFGTTYIEKSYNRPVRIGQHVILTPPERDARYSAPDIAVILKPGASFGVGQHATTRLAVEGVEYTLQELFAGRDIPDKTMLDIGTGSGVLALTALKMGIRRVTGTDIDPCAVAEATENAVLNGMSERFIIMDLPAESIEERFHMIAANLRYPTLMRLSDYISEHIHPQGAVILSGIRGDEAEKLKTRYAELSLKCRREKAANGWNGLVFIK